MALLPAFVILAQDADKAVSTTPARPMAERSPRYRIQPSDVLDIRFRFSPEFNQEIAVEPDGYISLQITGEMKVDGLTIAEATEQIIQKSAHVLRDPTVTISLKEFAKPAIYVGGNVVKPGRFELHGQMSVTDALATAGGMIPGSNDSEVVLFRRASNQMVEVKRINLKKAISKDALREDVMLQPNDSIYVSKSIIGKLERFMNVTHLGFYFPIPF